MAITVLKTPETVSPVYNHNYLRMTDDNYTQTNYKYIVYLYYKLSEAASYTLAGKFTYFPRENGVLEFDPMSVLNNYVENDEYDNDIEAWSTKPSVIQYKLTVNCIYLETAENTIATFEGLYAIDAALSQAEIDNLSTLIPVFNPEVDASAGYIDNWTFTDNQFISGSLGFVGTTEHNFRVGDEIFIAQTIPYTHPEYEGLATITGTPDRYTIVTNKTFLTSTPEEGGVASYNLKTNAVNKYISNVVTTLNLKRTDYYAGDIFLNVPGETVPTDVKLGIQIKTTAGYYYGYATTSPVDIENVEKRIVSHGIGPKNIEYTSWRFGLTTYTDIFNDFEFDEYKVFLYSPTDGAILSQPVQINVCENTYPRNIKNFDRVWLVYKSKWGGWSYLPFNMKKRKTQETAKVTYNRRMKYNETYKNRGTSVISNNVSQLFTLNTDWVPISEWEFYEDLFSSPQVYMLNTYINGEANTINPFEPCVITTSSTPIYSPNDDKLFSYTIEIETSNQRKRQLR